VKAQRNLITFVEKNTRLEDLQLINCQMVPEVLSRICLELEQMQGLQNLNLRKNVIRGKVPTKSFSEALARLVASAPALMHLDISGMFLDDGGVRKIMIEGVAESKTLAAVHF